MNHAGKFLEAVGAVAIAWAIVHTAFALTEPRIPKAPATCHCDEGGVCCCHLDRQCGCLDWQGGD